MELHGEFSFEVRVGQQHRRTETLNHKIVYNGDELSPNYTTIIHRQVTKFSHPWCSARERAQLSIRKFRAQNEDSMMCHPHADQQAMLWLNNILNKTHFYDTRLLHQPPASIVLHLSIILNYIY
ncbi:unnamed protein product [Porites lobata]|uniref:Uncharacterized protein n=1 Tax=Porites lobata TaxID=104759 RepID=A0ABN8N3E7_9CNID|nr:unnamed protein product [Porites lobata]